MGEFFLELFLECMLEALGEAFSHVFRKRKNKGQSYKYRRSDRKTHNHHR